MIKYILFLVGCTSLSHETAEVLNGRFHHLLPQIYPHSHSISTPFASAEFGHRALSLRGQQQAGADLEVSRIN